MDSNFMNKVPLEPLWISLSNIIFKVCFCSSSLTYVSQISPPFGENPLAVDRRLLVFPALQYNLLNLNIDDIERDVAGILQDIELNADTAIDFASIKIRLQL